MAVSRRPDVDGLRNETPEYPGKVPDHIEAYMWPYINQEDLCQRQIMLLFLTTRGRDHPTEFAAVDEAAMRVGRAKTEMQTDFLLDHVMMFTGRTDIERYGELIHWKDHPEAQHWYATRKATLAGSGLQILEAQERIMSFLVRFAMRVLHDFEGDALLSSPLQPTPTTATVSDMDFTSLATMAAEAPYRLPEKLVFNRIAAILAAKRDEAADHLLSLREDPGYFETCLKEWNAHRPEWLKDALGRPLFGSQPEHKSLFWSRVLVNNIMYAYMQAEMTAALEIQAKELSKMQELYAEDIKPEADLPAPYLKAILAFRESLEQQTQVQRTSLEVCFVSSPPNRDYYEYIPPRNEATGLKFGCSRRLKANFDTSQVNLEQVVLALTDLSETESLRVSRLVDELQRLADSSASAKNMISSQTASLISDLAVPCECIRQLEN